MAKAVLLQVPCLPLPPHSLFSNHPNCSCRRWSSPSQNVIVPSTLIIRPLTPTKATTTRFITSASQSPLVEEEEEEPVPIQEVPPRGCKACGREDLENGCNGEGRIQGGIATFPGFGWWPIKAYRPCPGFVASGGRYKRYGQSMDEVAWGRVEREASIASTDEWKGTVIVSHPSHKTIQSLLEMWLGLSMQVSPSWEGVALVEANKHSTCLSLVPFHPGPNNYFI